MRWSSLESKWVWRDATHFDSKVLLLKLSKRQYVYKYFRAMSAVRRLVTVNNRPIHD